MSYGYLITAVLVLILVPFAVVSYAEWDDNISTGRELRSPTDMLNLFESEKPTITNDIVNDCVTYIDQFSEENGGTGIMGLIAPIYYRYIDGGEQYFDCYRLLNDVSYDFQLDTYDLNAQYDTDFFDTVSVVLETVTDYTVGIVAWVIYNFTIANSILTSDTGFDLNPLIVITFFGIWSIILIFLIIEKVIPFT